MSESAQVFEVNAANFQQLVIDNSRRVPVLVDFWADWCAPCKMQLPVLLKLADDYQGKFILAKVNTDVEGELAAQHGIRSLPTLRLYRNGEVVEEILGAQPEATLRALIDPYIERESDRTLAAALEAAARGDSAQALSLLQSVVEADPGNTRAAIEYARLCLASGRLDTAESLIQGLPADVRETAQGKALAALLEFARSVESAPDADSLRQRLDQDPGQSALRYQLAARQVLAGRYDEALETLLELLRRDRAYGDGAAQRAMLGVFGLLGDDDERVARYRRQMFALLH